MTRQAHATARRRPLDTNLSHSGPAGRIPQALAPAPHVGFIVDAGRSQLGPHVGESRRRGRGASSNATGRFEPRVTIAFDDGWQSLEDLPPFRTEVAIDSARKVITRNESPDIPFDRSINVYRGCEHGCIYCFARPTHAFLGLSPGLDFESKLYMKPDAPGAPGAGTVGAELQAGGDRHRHQHRSLPADRAALRDHAAHSGGAGALRPPGRHRDQVHLVTRDIDILARMARRNLVRVGISVTTMDAKLARMMEPRAPTPVRRLEALRALSDAGIPTTVMAAPVIPAINDAEIERILDAGKACGAEAAGYVLLRLPLEVRDLFREWLQVNFPDRERHVFSLIRQTRDGKDYDAEFGKRMTGGGPYAWMIRKRFDTACARFGLNVHKTELTTTHFRPPGVLDEQLSLFA